ncbi:hypothetical protein B296_00015633 [Ensete ventricosum]|uniref:Uncharacterized protein n=1 Tax=Ensete ventricosum TaxID=4639 RepID=A0A427B632_ENSVE|nr:hypothetical protein B296_00015633 [Ensete ventricosum]
MKGSPELTRDLYPSRITVKSQGKWRQKAPDASSSILHRCVSRLRPVCASSRAVVSVRSWSSGIGRNLGVWLGKSTAWVVERGSEGGSTGCRPYLRQAGRTTAGAPILAPG